jgi:hypothetical protein
MKLQGLPIADAKFRELLIPFAADFRDSEASTYTPTGISVGEVKVLGDFPDYATLSGVPLPEPYEGFQLEKAVARPYRPFRWSYHQTMCMSSVNNVVSAANFLQP